MSPTDSRISSQEPSIAESYNNAFGSPKKTVSCDKGEGTSTVIKYQILYAH